LKSNDDLNFYSSLYFVDLKIVEETFKRILANI
jgi:hypothetical protein